MKSEELKISSELMKALIMLCEAEKIVVEERRRIGQDADTDIESIFEEYHNCNTRCEKAIKKLILEDIENTVYGITGF